MRAYVYIMTKYRLNGNKEFVKNNFFDEQFSNESTEKSSNSKDRHLCMYYTKLIRSKTIENKIRISVITNVSHMKHIRSTILLT